MENMSEVLFAGFALGALFGVVLDRVVLLQLARDLARNGWR